MRWVGSVEACSPMGWWVFVCKAPAHRALRKQTMDYVHFAVTLHSKRAMYLLVMKRSISHAWCYGHNALGAFTDIMQQMQAKRDATTWHGSWLVTRSTLTVSLWTMCTNSERFACSLLQKRIERLLCSRLCVCMCRMSLLVRTPIICQPIMLLWNGMKCRDVDMHSFVPFLRTYVVTVTFTGSLHVIENISDLLWHIVVYCTCIYSI